MEGVLSLFLVLMTIKTKLYSTRATNGGCCLTSKLFFRNVPPNINSSGITTFVVRRSNTKRRIARLHLHGNVILSRRIERCTAPTSRIPNTRTFLVDCHKKAKGGLPVNNTMRALGGRR